MTILIILIFLIGYLAITLEHPLRTNKAATAMLTGVLCWSVFELIGYFAGAGVFLLQHYFLHL